MALLPGWGSVEATRTIRDSCELLGIALFLVVVVLQIGSYCYGHRHDFLAAATARAAELRLQGSLEDADRRHAAETAVLQQGLAQTHDTPAPPAPEPRRLSDAQQSTLLIALSPFAGQPITFSSVMGNADAELYRTDFVDIIGRAHWAFDPATDITQAIMEPEPVGVQVAVSQADMDAGHPPGAVTTLVQTLDSLGITSGHTVFLSPEIPTGGIRLIIGVPHHAGG